MTDKALTLPFRLRPYFWSYKGRVIIITILGIVLGLVTALLGTVMGPAFEVLFSETTTLDIRELLGEFWAGYFANHGLPMVVAKDKILSQLPLVLIALVTFKFLAAFLIFFFWEYFSEKISFEFRERLAQDFLDIQASQLYLSQNRMVGDQLPAAIGNDVRQVRQYLVRFFGSMPREVFQIIFLVGAMLILSPQLFLLFFAIVAPIGIVVSRIGKKVKRRSHKALQQFSELSDWILKRLLGFETIKQVRKEESEIQAMTHKSNELRQKYDAIIRAKAINAPLIETISVIAIAVVLYLSSTLIANDTASASVQISFFSCLALLAQASAKLGRYVNIQAEGKAALDKLNRYAAQMRAITVLPPTTGEPDAAHCLEVRQLHVRTEQGFELNIPQLDFSYGQFYVLQGESGSGKSTLIKAILNLIKVDSGDIHLQLRNYSDALLSIIYVTQEYLPFHGTVRDNITYPLPPKASEDERLRECLRRAGFANFPPHFLDQKIGMALPALSGGQLQRLALARVFYHQPKLIILDECTSALDREAEDQVLASLQQLVKRGSCIIMSAHKEHAIKAAGKIINFSAGQITIIDSVN